MTDLKLKSARNLLFFPTAFSFLLHLFIQVTNSNEEQYYVSGSTKSNFITDIQDARTKDNLNQATNNK